MRIYESENKFNFKNNIKLFYTEGAIKMNQIMSWICLISICILCLQVMIFICEDTLKLFNSIILNNKNKRKKPATARVTYNYKNKIAK